MSATLRETQGRFEAEQDGGDQAEAQRADQDTHIQAYLRYAGQFGELWSHHPGAYDLCTPEGENASEGSSDQGQQERFAQQLPHDSQPPSTNRHADGDFPMASSALHDDHIAQIQTGDEQDDH